MAKLVTSETQRQSEGPPTGDWPKPAPPRRRRKLPAQVTLYLFGSPHTPARILRRLRAPSLEQAVRGRVVLVTGASSGIGRAAALRIGEAGATVLLVARTTEALEEVRAQIEASGGTAHVHPCDLRDPESVEQLGAEIVELYGRVDIFVNNAGRSIRRPIDESYDRLHDYERTMRLNYFAPLQLILALLPAMRQHGSGHIINVSTMGVIGRAPRWSAYVASKSALDAFSHSIAIETRGDGVRITNIHFPLVHTPMAAATAIYNRAPGLTTDDAADEIVEAIRTKTPRLTPRLGALFGAGWLISPAAMQALLSRFFQRSLESERADSPEGGEANGASRGEGHVPTRARE
jgi:NAD(P)-dependent dehydrogenase (short-subunit alcohol dehydrogenase family)